MKQASTKASSPAQQSGLREYMLRPYAVQFAMKNGEVVAFLRFTSEQEAEDTAALFRQVGFRRVKVLSAQ